MTFPIPQPAAATELSNRGRILAALPKTTAKDWAPGKSVHWIEEHVGIDGEALEWYLARMVSAGDLEKLTGDSGRLFYRCTGFTSAVADPAYPGSSAYDVLQVDSTNSTMTFVDPTVQLTFEGSDAGAAVTSLDVMSDGGVPIVYDGTLKSVAVLFFHTTSPAPANWTLTLQKWSPIGWQNAATFSVRTT